METTPADLRKVLVSNPKALAQWKELTSIGRRDFVSWIHSAKRPETHKRRIDSVPSRLASGKRRPCCYALVPMNLYKALDGNAKAKAQWKSLTPNEKRDFNDWLSSIKDANERAVRIAKICAMLASGKSHP